MTCFWDALRSKLNISDDNNTFILNLKKKNKKTKDVIWNNCELRDKQLEENFIHIREFNEKNINNGYLCSICEPFLFLICDIYNISINHDYLGNIMKYEKKNSNKILNFSSNHNHFW